MGRGEYGGTGHESIGNQALLALLPWAVCLGCCTTRAVWETKRGDRNIPQYIPYLSVFLLFCCLL